MSGPLIAFPPQFDRAVAACARAQVLLQRSAAAAARAREMRQSARRIRRHAVETREAWAGADVINTAMRQQVARVARVMCAAGMAHGDAAAAVRAHIRFVLYDGGLSELQAEPVVARADAWVEEIYRAA